MLLNLKMPYASAFERFQENCIHAFKKTKTKQITSLVYTNSGSIFGLNSLSYIQNAIAVEMAFCKSKTANNIT